MQEENMKRLKEVSNPRDYERTSKWLKKRLVEDYFTKRVTKEASDYFRHNEAGDRFIRNEIRKQLYREK